MGWRGAVGARRPRRVLVSAVVAPRGAVRTAAKIEAVTVGGNVAWGADASYDFRETGWVAGARRDTPRNLAASRFDD